MYMVVHRGTCPVLYFKNLEIYFSRDLQNLEIGPPKLRKKISRFSVRM